jgi:hypothetical protein
MQTRVARTESLAPTPLVAAGLVLTGLYASFLMVLMSRTPFDVWGAAVLAPVLIAVSLPVLRRQAIREDDPATFRLLVLAMVVKLGGAVALYYVSYTFYGGVADAGRYHVDGVVLAEHLRRFDFSTLHMVVGTRFMSVVTGIAYGFIGTSRMGGFIFFSWLGFWGLFLFYRAFLVAVPAGRGRSYAHFLFFLPSLVFWPSSTGKEAWMMFTLGIAAYGIAKVLHRGMWRGFALVASGLWLAGMVRPHMAALAGVSFAAAVVTRKSKPELRELAPILKVISIAAVAVFALALVGRSDRFLKGAGLDPQEGVTSTLETLQQRTAIDQSEFVPSLVDSPARAPLAAVTVLFRPFVFEANSFQARLAAIEGTALMLIVLMRVRWGFAALRSLRSQPYVVFCLVYSALFIVAFSSFANFGLLARERVQLYPLFFVLFSIPPAPIGPSGPRRASLERVAA